MLGARTEGTWRRMQMASSKSFKLVLESSILSGAAIPPDYFDGRLREYTTEGILKELPAYGDCSVVETWKAVNFSSVRSNRLSRPLFWRLLKQEPSL